MDANLKSFIDAFWKERMALDPEFGIIIGTISDSARWALDDRSYEGHTRRYHSVVEAHRKLTKLFTPKKAARLSKEDQLTLQIFTKQLVDYERCWDLHTFLCPVNLLEGPHTDLPMLAGYLQIKSDADFDAYLRLLKSIPTQIAQYIQLMQLGIEKGKTPPKVSVQDVPTQIDTLLSAKPSLFRKPLDDRFAGREAFAKVINDDVNPAFLKLRDFVETQYLEHCKDGIACTTSQPQGETLYAECLYYHTSTRMTPDEIHSTGLSEVKRINEEMAHIALAEGFPDAQAYANHLRTDPNFVPKSSEEHLTNYRSICMEIMPLLPKLIKTLPRTPFGVIPTPDHQADQAPAAYYLGPSGDGKRPGEFFVNCSKLESRKTYEMDSLALHEAIPGHHLQTSLSVENENLMEFQRFFEDRRYFECPARFPLETAYIEGWGLHSEDLGFELGRYRNNSSHFGKLSMEMWRACRLVVDTGMHALGWSMERATTFLMENSALSEANAKAEIVRYVTWPGQACAYKIGELKFKELRKHASSQLGDRFDVREYYDAVLGCGSVPLEILDSVVEEFIKRYSQ